MADEKKDPQLGRIYETKEIPDKGLPQGTLVKIVEIKGDEVKVRRASGEKVWIKIVQLIGFLLVIGGCYLLFGGK